MTKLYNICIETRHIPQQWKEANVCGIFKKGDRKDPLNYRPVSLTCIVCKIYEKFIRHHILSHIEDRIVDCQHGFVNGKSCFSNLLESFDAVLQLLEEGNPVDMFYMDYAKAFDTVPHFRLLTQLENMGITGTTLNIIKDFISERKMRTCVGKSRSKLHDVLSGIPQGSVFGPLLFVIFINDLPKCLNSITMLFADDLKLIVNAKAYEETAADLRALEEWEILWLLKFNTVKCKVMHLSLNSNPNNKYIFNGKTLESMDDKSKDLGIIPDNKMLWSDQIQDSISKANSMISWVTRNLVSREKSVMLHVYKASIRHHLEYCSQIWSPTAAHGNWGIILALESVQRRFTRLIDGVGLLPYSERLRILNLTTLAERRIRGDLIETFKILNNIVPYGKSVFNVGKSGLKLISKPALNCNKTVQRCVDAFLPQRVTKYWNLLPNSVRMSKSVNSFKSNLQNFKNNSIMTDLGNYWEVSDIVLGKIEGKNYLTNKARQNLYLKSKPKVAKRKGINVYVGECEVSVN